MKKIILFLLLSISLQQTIFAQIIACPSCGSTGPEQIYNGDFETNFTSPFPGMTYPYTGACTGNLAYGTYAIGNNAYKCHMPPLSPYIWNAIDHTFQDITGFKAGNPKGHFLIIDPTASVNGISDEAIWQTTVTVCPNTNYQFSFWAKNLLNKNSPYPYNPTISMRINGVDVSGTKLTIPNTSSQYPSSTGVATWQQITGCWNSGSNTSVVLTIYNYDTGDIGNDLGIDDISFRACLPPIIIPPVTICQGTSTTLDASSVVASNYTWIPATGLNTTTGPTVIASPSTTTTYTVYSSNSPCPVASGTVTVTVKNCATLLVNTTGYNTCNGVCGTVTSTATSGTPPYSYLWNTGATTATITECPIVTTTYTITVTDNSIPIATATAIAVITINSIPIVSVPNSSICQNTSTTLTASGANTYVWSPATGLNTSIGTSVTASPSGTTTYTVTGTNTTGCTGTTTVIVTVNPAPVVVVPNASICPGDATPLTATGATTYTWSPAIGLNTTTGSSVTANPAATTTYTVCGTANNCFACTTVTVSVGALIANAGPDVFICSGGTGTQLSASGGSNYSWSPATGLNNPAIFNPIASPAVTTTYTVTVSSASCTATDEVVVTVDPPILLNVAPVNASCNGLCNGQTIVIPSGGNGTFSYKWSSGCTAAACNNICAGTYTLTTTDGVGCIATGMTTVTEPTALTISVTGQTNLSCFGMCNGTASVSANGGTPPYSYSWNTTPVQVTAAATNLCAGTFACTVTDANGCTVKTSVVITQPAKIIVTSTGASICQNACATLVAVGSGGTGVINFNWNPGGISICPTVTTTYTLTGTDANGCVGTNTAVVIVNPIPIINVPSATICQNTSAKLTASGANTYSWYPTTGLSSTTGTTVIANPSVTSTYTIVGTSATGCTGSTSVIVTVTPAPVVTATGGSACPGNAITLKASGAVLYKWSPASGLNPTTGSTVTATPNNTTTYTVTGTSANGCTATTIAVASVYPKPVAAFISSPEKIDIFNPTVYFTDQSTGGIINSWNWNLGELPNSTFTIQNPSFTYPDIIQDYQIQLIVTNQYGCIDTTYGTIHVRGIFTFFVPNTFTPNGNGLNDGFTPKGVGIDETDYDLWIFDRWGNMIWHTNIWGEAWDGRANKGSDIAQIDTYVWKVHVREKEARTIHNYIGHVNIVK